MLLLQRAAWVEQDYNEIVANEYMGDFKRAASLMEEYLRKYPDDTDASREYIFLSTR